MPNLKYLNKNLINGDLKIIGALTTSGKNESLEASIKENFFVDALYCIKQECTGRNMQHE